MNECNEVQTVKYKRLHKLKYGKWGLIFILPFFVCYGVFQLYPLISTFYRSFFHDRTDIFLNEIFEFVGFDNYLDLFTKFDFVENLGNTLSLWLLGFIPQIVFSFLFAFWFTDMRLKLRGAGVVKVILYLPNMLMASSIAVLLGRLFAVTGPINQILGTSIHFLENEWGIRLTIAFINFLMWTGNTTILLMAGIMGINPTLYEASSIDGASSVQQFRRITLPLLKPIILYVLITSMIGGLQAFDIPNLIVNKGGTNGVATTVVMDISARINSAQGDRGIAGAESVLLFLVAGIIGIFLFRLMQSNEDKEIRAREKAAKKAGKQAKGAR